MSDRQEIERAASEEVLRQMPAAVLIAEASSGKIIFSNRAARQGTEQVLGQPVPQDLEQYHDLHDSSDFKMLHPEGQPYEVEEWPLTRSIRSGEEVRDEEVIHLLGDGTQLWVCYDSSPIRDDEGRIVAGVVIFYVITEQKRAEEKLKASEERFRLLAENAKDIIYRFRFKPTPGFEYVSPSATDLTGYTPEDHYADPELGLKLVYPDDRRVLEAFLRSPESADRFLTLRWIRKDGRIIWTEQQISPFYDDQGELVAIEGIGRNITERKELEDALRQSEERFRSLVQNASDIIIILEANGTIRYVSPA